MNYSVLPMGRILASLAAAGWQTAASMHTARVLMIGFHNRREALAQMEPGSACWVRSDGVVSPPAETPTSDGPGAVLIRFEDPLVTVSWTPHRGVERATMIVEREVQDLRPGKPASLRVGPAHHPAFVLSLGGTTLAVSWRPDDAVVLDARTVLIMACQHPIPTGWEGVSWGRAQDFRAALAMVKDAACAGQASSTMTRQSLVYWIPWLLQEWFAADAVTLACGLEPLVCTVQLPSHVRQRLIQRMAERCRLGPCRYQRVNPDGTLSRAGFHSAVFAAGTSRGVVYQVGLFRKSKRREQDLAPATEACPEEAGFSDADVDSIASAVNLAAPCLPFTDAKIAMKDLAVFRGVCEQFASLRRSSALPPKGGLPRGLISDLERMGFILRSDSRRKAAQWALDACSRLAQAQPDQPDGR